MANDFATDASLGEDPARPITAQDRELVVEEALRRKLDRLEDRLASLHAFDGLSMSSFIEQLPGFERLMPLLAQSAIDICHSMLRRQTVHLPRSQYDIMDACEQLGVLPAPVIKSLARQVVLAERGYRDLDAADLLLVQKQLPDASRAFRELLALSRDALA